MKVSSALLSDGNRLLAERHLFDFLRQGWPVLEPETPFEENWHIELVCEYLEAATRGQIRRLIINMPPRHTKSLAATVFWPVWNWIATPGTRWLFTSYSSALSTDHSLKRRMLIESVWFQRLWGQSFRLAGDQNVKTHFENSRQGAMVVTSLGGSITGFGGDYIVVDDPHNADDQDNTEAIQRDVESYRRTTANRLNDARTGRIVVIGHRLHMQDLSAWLPANQPGEWTQLVLRARAEDDEEFRSPSSGRVFARERGKALHPARFNLGALEQIERAQSSRRYAGQYQQRPAPLTGNVIKREWIKFWRALPAELDEIIQSWDMSFKDTRESAFVAGHVWGRKGANKYLIDRVHDRMGFTAAKNAVLMLSAKWPQAHRKLIEDKANGPAIMDALRETVAGIIAVAPMGSKYARLEAASVDFQAGNVFLPDPSIAPWVHDVVEELCTFPGSLYSDDVDAADQAINTMRQAPRSLAVDGLMISKLRESPIVAPGAPEAARHSLRKVNF